MDFQDIVGVATVIVAILSIWLSLRKNRKRKQRKISISLDVPSPVEQRSSIPLPPTSGQEENILEGLAAKARGDLLTQDLIKGMTEQVLASAWSTSPDADQAQIVKKVKGELTEVKDRITKIEKEAKLDEIASINDALRSASINDALLSERIDRLDKQVTILEDKRLSRWDVVTVIGYVIGAIIVISGATYTLFKVFGLITIK